MYASHVSFYDQPCWDRHLLRVGQKGIIVFVPKSFHGKVGVQFDKADQGREGYSSDAQIGFGGMHKGTQIEWCYCMFLWLFFAPVFIHTNLIWMTSFETPLKQCVLWFKALMGCTPYSWSTRVFLLLAMATQCQYDLLFFLYWRMRGWEDTSVICVPH